MPARDPIVFTHVPKTAGGSIHYSVQVAFGLEPVFIVTGGPSLAELRELVGTGRQYIYVGGHVTAEAAREIFPDATLVAALRPPVERLLSHFFYLLRQGLFAVEAGDHGTAGAFQRFYDSSIVRHGGTNALCTYLSGKRSAKAAISAVEESYTIVWNAERTGDVWPKVYRLCAEKAGVVPKDDPGPLAELHIADIAANRNELALGARPQSYDGFLPRELQTRIEADNAEDLRLIEWLEQTHAGLFEANRQRR